MEDNRFKRTEALIGGTALMRLEKARVAVFGVGGVGSFAADAVARAGIGSIDIFDRDTVDITNINRQLIALDSTVGKNKAEVMKERIADINPYARVTSNVLFVTRQWVENADFSVYDYIIDCIDNITAKIAICEKAYNCCIPVISAMGAGNKLDPSLLKVDYIENTSVCPLARIMRKELKARGINKVKVVYTTEQPLKKSADTENNRPVPASISFVPSVAGLLMAGEVIKDIAGINVQRRK